MKKWFLFCISYFIYCGISMAQPLPAAEVFHVNLKQNDSARFTAQWQIKSGYFLYSDRIKVTSLNHDEVDVGDIPFPSPLKKFDTQKRPYPVYRHALSLPINVLAKRPGEALLELHYQGCADDGFCYPPETKEIKISINSHLALTGVEFYSAPPSLENPTKRVDEPTIEAVFFNHHSIMVLIIFFGFGLLLSFTPCILPMVPVLSGIIIGHSATLSTRKAFFLSLSYVLSMAITYAIAGAIVAQLGSNLQIIMQTPWVIGVFSFIFVLLALSMFGFFDLKLPISWQTKLARVSHSYKGGHYFNSAMMGALSTLILSPCVTAPLIGILSYIAQSGNILLGSLSLFFLGLGMGTPLILIGTSAGHWLPKAGTWMHAIKAFFGVVLLGVAIFLLSRIVPAPLTMGLWAVLLIFCSIYIGAFIQATTLQEKCRQSIGIILLIYGIIILIGASMGNPNPLQPLANYTNQHALTKSLLSQPVKTIEDVQHAVAGARGKIVMLDFYADWCVSCHIMEATTFKNPAVLAALQNVLVLKADVTANDKEDKRLMQKYGVIAPPTFLFFDQAGNALTSSLFIGELSANDFLQKLRHTL